MRSTKIMPLKNLKLIRKGNYPTHFIAIYDQPVTK